jgi:hypothetical protein
VGEVTAVRYVGPGYLLGVPARDLSVGEWDALTDVQRSAVRWSGIYEVVVAELGLGDPNVAELGLGDPNVAEESGEESAE